MRRKDKEITDRKIIDEIIAGTMVCRIGMSEDNHPYIVPVNFGYENNSIYFHCAHVGKKIDILKKNNIVCVEFDIMEDYLVPDVPCKGSIKYKSIIANGRAFFVDDTEEKKHALSLITEHVSGKVFEFTDEMSETVTIIRIDILEISCKVSDFKGENE
ncbi:MAG: pyridoxamine 5'-phosphate oxidase family protein [Candidatus Coatesbacteria bacterium]|nr:pyridoxamine 5'-phosphate oxidase family protein [Candidatus Coatesbacteria bacterium]